MCFALRVNVATTHAYDARHFLDRYAADRFVKQGGSFVTNALSSGTGTQFV